MERIYKIKAHLNLLEALENDADKKFGFIFEKDIKETITYDLVIGYIYSLYFDGINGTIKIKLSESSCVMEYSLNRFFGFKDYEKHKSFFDEMGSKYKEYPEMYKNAILGNIDHPA
jgi:hypothetical protein